MIDVISALHIAWRNQSNYDGCGARYGAAAAADDVLVRAGAVAVSYY
ncbi:hypothetical protein [Paenibacillus agri]|uniref:Uncharacterized protein n=1 Tax=Paenibacillus agri TaxID=2744309 RepID=A0A850EHZ7_9BACL|nr:hypothetical protein [Paenibacillus agri]NUU60963.1 hypothetical protein [Paenibacillus agri]